MWQPRLAAQFCSLMGHFSYLFNRLSSPTNSLRKPMGLRIFSNIYYIVFGSMPILDMAYVTKFTALRLRLSVHRRLVTAIPPNHAFDYDTNYHHVLHNFYLSFAGKRRQSSNAEWATKSEFAGRDAYGILGVSQTSSFSEIKASFCKLAKETHPDLARSRSHTSSASEKFIQIVAAYEVLLFSEDQMIPSFLRLSFEFLFWFSLNCLINLE